MGIQGLGLEAHEVLGQTLGFTGSHARRAEVFRGWLNQVRSNSSCALLQAEIWDGGRGGGRVPFWGPYNKEYNILRSILGSPFFYGN